MNKKQKERFLNLILLLISFILIISNLILFLKYIQKDDESKITEDESQNENEITEEDVSSNEENDITAMTEQQRMIYYMNEFLDKIENKEYDEAYKYLNQEFKDRYFKTLDDFKNYSEKNFDMSTMAVEFNNIERLGNPVTGNMYVLWVKLVDVLRKNENNEPINFVILEKDYNDFELSFKVIM